MHKSPLTILGLSKSGVAVARYAQQHGWACLLSDTQPATAQNAAWRDELTALGVTLEMGGHGAACFHHADTVVASPGIPPHAPVMQQLILTGKTILSEPEWAWQQFANRPQPPRLVGITGTNGKTTTTTLLSAIFTAAGHYAPACGNIGLPLASLLDASPAPEVLVAELSSYQLHWSRQLRAEAAIFLNLTPDHLDWHGAMGAYEAAKARLFTAAQSPHWAILNARDPASHRYAQASDAQIVWFSNDAQVPLPGLGSYGARFTCDHNLAFSAPDGTGWTLGHRDTLKLRGRHNIDNVLAAASAAWVMGVPPDVIRTACQAFSGVEHRLEHVCAWTLPDERTLHFWNDSKATNPEAAICALEAFDEETPASVVLVAGGRDKHGPLDAFSQVVQRRAAAAILFGEAQQRFAEALRPVVPVCQCNTLDEALALAIDEALHTSRVGHVLFSPACASFDQYDNFEARGRAFKALVQAQVPAVAQPGLEGALAACHRQTL
jgi:UDP-N-acetylmuramoylalanine--D-glutamate ligase